MMENFALYSRVYKRLTRRYQAQLPYLAAGQPTKLSMQQCFTQLLAEFDMPAALRVLRQLVLQRLIELDCNQRVGAEVITRSMTELAEYCLDSAYQFAMTKLVKIYGQPVDEQQNICDFWIVGMGKLGARELNVSSDIDLVYVYQYDSVTQTSSAEQKSISNQEFFSFLVREIYALIGEITEHGFVFRIDLALRPNGREGPVAISLQSFSDYLQKHGREWERFAWLKARVIAPLQTLTNKSFIPLYDTILPFVYRPYFDFKLYASMRDLHHKIDQQKGWQSASRPELANDIKLSRGGIREIEFSTQIFQVVRGGTYPELRVRATLSALKVIQQLELINSTTEQQLAEIYRFYRDIEHRIQYLDDQQTHILPRCVADLTWLAKSLGFVDSVSFLQQVKDYQDFVIKYGDSILRNPLGQTAEDLASSIPVEQPANLASVQPASYLSTETQDKLTGWFNSSKFLAQSVEVQHLLQQIIKLCSQAVADNYVQEKALHRMLLWLDSILGRTTYIVLLNEKQNVLYRLLKLFNKAYWTLNFLKKHPRVIDELARNNFVNQRFAKAKFIKRLELRKSALHDSADDDEENLLNLLRVAQKTESFKILASDIEGYLTVEQVADDLSALADAILQLVVDWSWDFVRKKHQEQPNLLIIAYGKLGGKELGYGSDLDLVFLYDDSIDKQEIYIALVRKIINWLTAKTAEGDLYEIDTALRPNGNSGLLTTSFVAYTDYQIQRGSNVAWLWEHQALTRARLVVGSTDLAQQFAQIRQRVLCMPRDAEQLKNEVLAMRTKLYQAHKDKPNEFDIKQGRGGMIDIEFAVQYIVLRYSAQHPQLTANLGNIALLQIAEELTILPQPVGQAAAQAYRWYRCQQHLARLDGLSSKIELAQAQTARQAIIKLWQSLFD